MTCQLHQDGRTCAVVVYTVAELNAVKVCAEGDVLIGVLGAFDLQHYVSGWTGHIVLNQGEGHRFRFAFDQLHRIDGTQNAAGNRAVAQCPVTQFSFAQVGILTNIRNVSVPGQKSCNTVTNQLLIHFFIESAAVDQNDLALFVIQVDVVALLYISKLCGQTFRWGAARTAVAFDLPFFAQCFQRNLVDVSGFYHKFFNGRFHTLFCQLILDDIGSSGFLRRGAGADKVDFFQVRKDAFSHCIGVFQNIHVLHSSSHDIIK